MLLLLCSGVAMLKFAHLAGGFHCLRKMHLSTSSLLLFSKFYEFCYLLHYSRTVCMLWSLCFLVVTKWFAQIEVLIMAVLHVAKFLFLIKKESFTSWWDTAFKTTSSEVYTWFIGSDCAASFSSEHGTWKQKRSC